jgi:hypothetical protein
MTPRPTPMRSRNMTDIQVRRLPHPLLQIADLVPCSIRNRQATFLWLDCDNLFALCSLFRHTNP